MMIIPECSRAVAVNYCCCCCCCGCCCCLNYWMTKKKFVTTMTSSNKRHDNVHNQSFALTLLSVALDSWRSTLMVVVCGAPFCLLLLLQLILLLLLLLRLLLLLLLLSGLRISYLFASILHSLNAAACLLLIIARPLQCFDASILCFIITCVYDALLCLRALVHVL